MSPSPLSSDEKRAKLAALLKAQATQPQQYPTSLAQQRLWFIAEYEPDSPAYLIFRAHRLRGPLDESALEASLNAIVARHAALRTTFALVAGQPTQLVAPTLTIPLARHDLRGLPERERLSEARRMAEAEALRPFDLARGPLLRWSLLRLGDDDHVLIWGMHHIVSDGWSLDIFLRELAACYAAQRAGIPANLPPLPIQYPDFAYWQRQQVAGTLEREANYWQAQLGGALPPLALPTDHPRPAVQRSHGAHHPIEIAPALHHAIATLSRHEGVTLFMTLLTAFQVLLHRLSGQREILVGTPVAGRTQQATERLIGFFVNTLVLRGDLSSNPSFRDLLAKTRHTTLAALAHQALPFEKLVEVLAPERDLSRSPLFQTLFSLHKPSSDGLHLDGLTVEPLPIPRHLAPFDLSLILEEREQGLQGVLEYQTALFDPATIARWAGHFRTLLEAIAADPTRRVSDLPLMTEAEQQQVLSAWNPPPRPYPREYTLAELWEAQVAATPDAVALVAPPVTLSYDELNRRANQLAHHLHTQGIQAGDRVGLLMERSPAVIVATLATLKLGAAYLPLDPTHPAERLLGIAEDARLALLLTEGASPFAPGDAPCPLLDLPTLAPTVAQASDQNPPPRAHPDSVAYVMYTSGSTGKPKGIAIPHRGIVRLVHEQTYLPFGPDLCFLQLSALAFDVSTLEIWGPLLHGGRLVLFPPGPPSLEAIARLIADEGVNTLWLTAGLFHQMAAHQLDGLRPLRYLLAGGDVLAPAAVERVLRELPDCCLINGYGPTENTTFTTCHPMQGAQSFEESVPIGRPIAHSEVLLLDAHLQPVPVGIVADLYTGGDGLAHGYVARPALTAETFIPHPYSATPGARLYRTGDRARWLPDGTLAFLGRADFQLKLRGFRIEPGEIESHLARHPALRDAIVVPREIVPGSLALVAYLVPRAAPAPEPSELRAFLAPHLPDYMLPTAFVFLDALPLNANGKVERRVLPLPDRAALHADATPATPRTPVEELLAAIWGEVLHLESVGIHDNFFTLGGHSLLATQVASRIRELFHIELPLRTLFESPTIAELALPVEQALAADGGDEVMR